MNSKKGLSIFWFRRDLRLQDNAGLYYALKSGNPVLCLFIFDRDILDKLPKKDARVLFIHQEIERLRHELKNYGSALLVKYGKPMEVHKEVIKDFKPTALFANRDYEPYARERDKNVFELYKSHEIPFKGYKDHVIFEKNEVVKDDGNPYVVYTPYSKTYKSKLTDFYVKPYPTLKYAKHFMEMEALKGISLAEMGFEQFEFDFPNREINKEIIKNYHKTRDIPSVKGTSRLSLHLRFGTISIRELAKVAIETNEKYFNELIWRDFYQSILYHFPKSLEKAFREKYDEINWENNEEHFKAWCTGKTGYPLVDAGMRELNETGFMHNRVRMLVASFLTKHLLIDWRWGETYFAEKLLDYEAASNVGGWQWAAGSGVDAAPYFRIFNPTTQLDKFDKDLTYVKRWVKEYGTSSYPKPIIEHKQARERALARYKEVV